MGDSSRENSIRPAGIPTPGAPTQITASHISPNALKPRLLDQVRQAPVTHYAMLRHSNHLFNILYFKGNSGCPATVGGNLFPLCTF